MCRSVMTGFINALAILIFMAQLPKLIGVPGLTYVKVAAGIAIIYAAAASWRRAKSSGLGIALAAFMLRPASLGEVRFEAPVT